jgi:hypothetical protein
LPDFGSLIKNPIYIGKVQCPVGGRVVVLIILLSVTQDADLYHEFAIFVNA